MKGTITLNGAEKKEIGVVANGYSPIFYRRLFGKDIMGQVTNFNLDSPDDIFVSELLFVMKEQAERERQDLGNVTMDDYYDWLESIDGGSIMYASADVIMFYLGQTKTASKPKKKDA